MRIFLQTALFILLFWHATSAIAHTQVMTEAQSLGFGKFAMRDNDMPYSIIMSPMGSETYPPGIYPFNNGIPGIFQLTDFTPSQLLGVAIADTTLTSTLDPGDYFDLVDFTFNPVAPTTNGAGDVTISIGATLRTSGNGTLYTDDTYTGTYTLNVIY